MARLVLSLLLCWSALANDIDQLVRAEMEKQRVPGIAVAVVRDGKIVVAKGYGLANVEHQVPVTTSTVFQGASIGKQFTATAVMMLVEEGKVALDEKISKYLGDVPPSWAGITVRHLLTHTSGLTQYPPGFDQRRDYSEDELLKIIQSVPLAFAPGTRFEYSNAGYVTLGVLIRRVTGQYYGDVLKKRIFEPLGMATARVISEAAIVPNRAAGYILYEGKLVNQPWIAPTLNRTADASLYFSVLDLAKWDAALYGETLLKRASLEQMWTPAKLSDGTAAPYGFGWFISSANGHRLIEHEGAWQGFNANIARYVDDRLTVIVMSNLKSAKTQMLSHRIAGTFLPAVAPPQYAPIADAEPHITKLIREVMLRLAAGEDASDAFSPAGRAAFFPGTAKMFASYLKPLGPPAKVQLVKRSKVPEGRLYRYEFTYGALTLLVSATLDDKGKIAALTAADNY
jgi:D-alanyl-D-alanine carboxypeptidase